MAMIAASCQGQADITALYNGMPALFDIDTAVGVQLDAVGQWVGRSRVITDFVPGNYFSFDTPGQGFDQSVWGSVYGGSYTSLTLSDNYYRLLLKTAVLNNNWNCSTPQAYSFTNALWSAFGYSLLIEDLSNLTMKLGLIGLTAPNSIVEALFNSGALDVRPIGVTVTDHFYLAAAGPVFALDLNSAVFGGLDIGSWAT